MRISLWMALVLTSAAAGLAQSVVVLEWSLQDQWLVRIPVDLETDSLVFERQSLPPFLHHDWCPLYKSKVIFAGLDTIFLLSGRELDTLYCGIDSAISDVVATPSACYFREWEDEQTESSLLKRIDLSTKHTTTLRLSPTLSFCGLNIMPNEAKMSFFQVIERPDPDEDVFRYIVYDTQTRQITIIDSVENTRIESFGIPELDGTLSTWDGEGNLLYFRLDHGSKKGRIYRYDTHTMKRSKAFDVPEECFRPGFAYHRGLYFFVQGNALVSFDIHGNKKVLYKARSEYTLLPKIYIR